MAALACGALALLALGLAWLQAPALWRELIGRGLPLLLLAIVNGLVAFVAVWRFRPRVARVAVAGQVILVLAAWAVGQWPQVVPPDLGLEEASAPQATLLVVVVVGMALLLPSLYALFRVFKGDNPAVL